MSRDRYKTNPFLENMIIPMKGQRVKLSRIGRDQNVLINQGTGEIHGTHITTYRNADSEQFVKLFTSNIALAFSLQSPGIKAFSVLIWVVQHRALLKDEVDLDALTLSEFLVSNTNLDAQQKLSIATFKRGVNELEDAKIIAKTLRQGRYFINPNFIFNGDRIAFTTVIERVKRRTRDPNTIDMIDGLTDSEKSENEPILLKTRRQNDH